MREVVPVMPMVTVVMMAMMVVLPPSAAERQAVVVPVTLPVIANVIGGDKPVAVSPATGLVAMIAAVATLATPGIAAPRLVFAVDRCAIAKTPTVVATAVDLAIHIAETPAPVAVAWPILVATRRTIASLHIAKAPRPRSIALVSRIADSISQLRWATVRVVAKI